MNTKRSKKNVELRQKAFKYHYLNGLNSKEISKILDVSFRTVQKWSLLDNWKAQKQADHQDRKVWELKQKGFSYIEICEKLGICRATAYNRIKRYEKSLITDKKE